MPYARNRTTRIHYVIEGSGPPLVLHHGFTGSHHDWTTFGFVDALKDRYQLIMPDARGHGDSDKPYDPAGYGFEHGVGDIVAILDDLGIDQAHYYGYSYGGMMGWALGQYVPERFTSMVIGGAHPGPPDAAVWDRLDRVRQYLGQGIATYVAWRESQTGAWPPAFRERVLGNDVQALTAFISVSPDQRSEHQPVDLRLMTMPVLVISGDDDELYAGSRARQAADALPSGTFIEIPGADHFTLYARGGPILPHLTTFLARVSEIESHDARRLTRLGLS